MNLLDKNFQIELKENINSLYNEFLNELREDIEDGYENSISSNKFLKELKSALFSKSLDKNSSLSFYWLNLIEKYITIVQLHEELDQTNETDPDYNNLAEEIFSFWEESEYASEFMEMAEGKSSFIEDSLDLIQIFENQIISFFYLHISDSTKQFDPLIVYRAFPEIGDFQNRIYVGNHGYFIDINSREDIFPNIFFNYISEETIEVDQEDEVHSYPVSKAVNRVSLDNLELTVNPSCSKGIETISTIGNKISDALNVLKTFCPDLFKTLSSFTHTIVPIDEPGVVSYSMQELPGYSCINLFERDFIDLIDDLIHENGHHFLNCILNQEHLINEDDEKIYYSPWRRSLRPIRGIYHAVFTFYWAFKLFNTLLNNLNNFDSTHKFSSEEIDKIKNRMLEEYFMLEFCKTDLDKAHSEGKVTAKGNELISVIYKDLEKHKDNIVEFSKEYNDEKINDLRKLLEEMNIKYR